MFYFGFVEAWCPYIQSRWRHCLWFIRHYFYLVL